MIVVSPRRAVAADPWYRRSPRAPAHRPGIQRRGRRPAPAARCRRQGAVLLDHAAGSGRFRRLGHASGSRISRRRPGRGLADLGGRVAAMARAAHALPDMWHSDGRVSGRMDSGLPQRCQRAFPRTDPAVIMVVHDGGDRCLLGRGQAWGEGRFSTLAGFVEPGESLEGAVAREVLGGGRRRGHRCALRREPALAVPVVAHGRVRRPPRRRPRRCRSTPSRWPRPAGSLARRLPARRRARIDGRRGRAGRRPAAHLPEAVDLALPDRLLVVGRDRSLMADSNCRVPRVVPSHDDVSESAGCTSRSYESCAEASTAIPEGSTAAARRNPPRDGRCSRMASPWPSSNSPATSTMASATDRAPGPCLLRALGGVIRRTPNSVEVSSAYTV